MEDDIPDYHEMLRMARKQEEQEEMRTSVDPRKARKRKVVNSGVQISGLPPDITVAEVAAFMGKYGGVIKKNPSTRQQMVRLLGDGCARVVYMRPESVQLVINMADEAEIKPGFPVRIKLAEWQKKSKKKGGGGGGAARRDKRIKTYDQEQELGWDEEEPKLHVIIKHIFTLGEVGDDPVAFFMELNEELLEELQKYGDVKNVKIFEYNPEGVIAVKYEVAEGASRCVEAMDGRFFAGRQLKAFYYDGFTNYKVEETEEARQKRIASFGKWLEDDEDDGDDDDDNADQ